MMLFDDFKKSYTYSVGDRGPGYQTSNRSHSSQGTLKRARAMPSGVLLPPVRSLRSRSSQRIFRDDIARYDMTTSNYNSLFTSYLSHSHIESDLVQSLAFNGCKTAAMKAT